MSKSLGNLVSVEEALERHSAESLRLYFLSSHYRSPLQYTDDGCAAMERSLQRLREPLPGRAGVLIRSIPAPLNRDSIRRWTTT